MKSPSYVLCLIIFTKSLDVAVCLSYDSMVKLIKMDIKYWIISETQSYLKPFSK
jgi:hypothetical protein